MRAVAAAALNVTAIGRELHSWSAAQKDVVAELASRRGAALSVTVQSSADVLRRLGRGCWRTSHYGDTSSSDVGPSS